MKLSRVGELSLLEAIRKNFAKKTRNVLVGIGDDAAVLKPGKEYLLATTDMMVEGVHFDLHFITAYQLGFKLISVNVSDIYAMGGNPSYVLLNVAVGKDRTKEFMDAFFEGVKDAMYLYRARLIGGDISSSVGGVSVSATLIGSAKRYIKRSGAKVGDRIYVTGNLGDSACGLAILKKLKRPVQLNRSMRGAAKGPAPYPLTAKLRQLGLSRKISEPLLRRHIMPEARNPEKISRYATSMIDISDGLLIDLWRLCDESRVGARIYEKEIPLSPELKSAAAGLGIDSLKAALSGGEDYELLFTAPASNKIRAIYIGDVIESKRVIVGREGRERRFSAEGYRHF